jgi:drug/metabolite transporter (DMT)-like permease
MIIYIAMVVMLISGTCNTILMKHQTNQVLPETPGGKPQPFDHPYIQTMFMMIGELACLAIFYAFLKKNAASSKKGVSTDNSFFTNWSQKSLFILPVLCDMTATTLVNMAFLKIPASVVQMTRGMIVFFTCLFSVIFLGRKQHGYHLVGVALVCAGITLVGYSQLNGLDTASAAFHAIVFGITLCVVAQAFQASMLVVEEKVLHDYSVEPLLAVGLEGFFGVAILSVVIPYMCYMPDPVTGDPAESVSGAFHQMSLSPILTLSVVASIFSIAFFNVSGITVTKEASAVARSTIDCSRTILVWGLELSFGWARFNAWQLIGFVLLATGTMLYNRILPVPGFLEAPEEKLNALDVDSTAASLEGVCEFDAAANQEHTSLMISSMSIPSVKKDEDFGAYNYGTLVHHFDSDTNDTGSQPDSDVGTDEPTDIMSARDSMSSTRLA